MDGSITAVRAELQLLWESNRELMKEEHDDNKNDKHHHHRNSNHDDNELDNNAKAGHDDHSTLHASISSGVLNSMHSSVSKLNIRGISGRVKEEINARLRTRASAHRRAKEEKRRRKRRRLVAEDVKRCLLVIKHHSQGPYCFVNHNLWRGGGLLSQLYREGVILSININNATTTAISDGAHSRRDRRDHGSMNGSDPHTHSHSHSHSHTHTHHNNPHQLVHAHMFKRALEPYLDMLRMWMYEGTVQYVTV